jgi:hypothetical protein
LAAALDGLPRNIPEVRRVPLGTFRGLRFGQILHPHLPPDAYLEGSATRQAMLSREHHGPRAILNALERLANDYGSECRRIQQELAIAESKLADFQASLGKPFPHDAYMEELTTLRDELKSLLSGRAPESGVNVQVSAAEITAMIKAKIFAHKTGPAGRRADTRQAGAETPVTTRIQRAINVMQRDIA